MNVYEIVNIVRKILKTEKQKNIELQIALEKIEKIKLDKKPRISDNCSNELLKIAIIGFKQLRRIAWKKLISKNPSKKDLIDIIKHVKSLRLEAWEKLIAEKPSDEDLKSILQCMEDSQFTKIVKRKLISQYPTEKKTEHVLNYTKNSSKK